MTAPPCPALLPLGEAEEEGYDDEYQLEDLDITPADYIKPVLVANFRNTWDALPAETEKADEYGLGTREGLQVCVQVRRPGPRKDRAECAEQVTTLGFRVNSQTEWM